MNYRVFLLVIQNLYSSNIIYIEDIRISYIIFVDSKQEEDEGGEVQGQLMLVFILFNLSITRCTN